MSKRYYSKSRVETDLTCQRKRYWGYEYDRTGLTPSKTPLPLALGTIIHDALGGLAEGLDTDDLAIAARDEMLSLLEGRPIAPEQAALVEGLVRGFAKAVWPSMTEKYEIVAIERMFEYEHGDSLVFLCKPDLLVRDSEGLLHYIEYKTTSSIKDRWFNSWDTAVQLHSAARVVKDALGEDLESVIVQGLYKGWSSYGKQSSPFCYGYHKPGQPPFQEEVWSYEYRSGLRRTPLWEKPGGVKSWVDGMPMDMLKKQFPQTPPIYPDDDLIDAFFKQAEYREEDVWEGVNTLNNVSAPPKLKDRVMNMTFRQNFSQCSPSFGSDCAFLDLCHGGGDVTSFAKREPHHEKERTVT